MKTLIPSLIATAMLLVPVAAPAQGSSCGPRDEVVATLLDRYGENFSGGGLQGERAVYEVWTSDEVGTWTILLTRPDGISCIMASGTDWLPQLDSHVVKGVKS